MQLIQQSVKPSAGQVRNFKPIKFKTTALAEIREENEKLHKAEKLETKRLEKIKEKLKDKDGSESKSQKEKSATSQRRSRSRSRRERSKSRSRHRRSRSGSRHRRSRSSSRRGQSPSRSRKERNRRSSSRTRSRDCPKGSWKVSPSQSHLHKRKYSPPFKADADTNKKSKTQLQDLRKLGGAQSEIKLNSMCGVSSGLQTLSNTQLR